MRVEVDLSTQQRSECGVPANDFRLAPRERPEPEHQAMRRAPAGSARSRDRSLAPSRAAPPTTARRAAPGRSRPIDTSEWQIPAPAVIRLSSPGRTTACTPALSRCSTCPAEQPTHRLQAGVRMRRDVHPRGYRAVVVDEAPGPDQRALPLRQGALHADRPGPAQGTSRGRSTSTTGCPATCEAPQATSAGAVSRLLTPATLAGAARVHRPGGRSTFMATRMIGSGIRSFSASAVSAARERSGVPRPNIRLSGPPESVRASHAAVATSTAEPSALEMTIR